MAPAPEHRPCKLSGHVGLDGLADQLVNKAVLRGFQFNILCVGETGVGKSTLIDTLFNRRFNATTASHQSPEVSLKSTTHEIREGNVNLRCIVTETVGFGDQINKEHSSEAITEYIDAQFERYLQEELKIKRNLQAVEDSRVHVCLYFVSPTGHSLKTIDLVTIRALHNKVNVIPVIAKSDTVTKQELSRFKTQIMDELIENECQIYKFPTDDEDVAELNAQMNAVLPFATVGSMDEIKVGAGGGGGGGAKSVRARQYPWGIVQVDNENHCDFVRLREMVLRTNMQDLIESTHTVHYERYRRYKLEKMGLSDALTEGTPGGGGGGGGVQEAYRTRRRQLQEDYQRREAELKQSFMVRVKEKEAELKEQEKQLHQKFDTIKAKHTAEKKQLDDEKRQLDEEVHSFQQRRATLQAQISSGTLSGGGGKKKK